MSDLLLHDGFDYADGLITNEYATHHQGYPGIHDSVIWEATSGSLFARGGQAYSGVPDDGRNGVDIDSQRSNGSAVLRVITRRADFVNVSVRFRLTALRLVTTDRTPEKAWNGFHVFMRRQDENNTYYVDVGRRDSTLQIKRKLRGLYQPLTETVRYTMPFGATQQVRVETWTQPSGVVELRLYLGDRLIQQAADSSADRILVGGSVGIRADNCEFTMDDFEVRSLGDR